MLDSPPISDVFSDEMDSVSVREKALLNRPMQRNSNFKDGYLPVNTTKPTSRGKKTFAFWTLVTLLFILAVGNLILTMTILAVLKLGQGMESIEVIPAATAIKLLGNVDLGHIYKKDGKLEGYDGEPVVITSEDSPIILNLYSRAGRPTTKLKVDKNETVFRGLTSFDVKSEAGQPVFNVTGPKYPSLRNARNLKSTRVYANKIRSSSGENLRVEADRVSLKGAEGTRIEGREVVWKAEEDVLFSTSNGSILLIGKEGTFLNVDKLHKEQTRSNSYAVPQFKVCVCVPGGKLFRVPVVHPNDRVFCHHVNMQHNFCI